MYIPGKKKIIESTFQNLMTCFDYFQPYFQIGYL
jgi:hypothetical protein